MRMRNSKLKFVVAAGLVALIALPGAAKPTLDATQSARTQSAFGLFFDPHVEPALVIDLPEGFSAT